MRTTITRTWRDGVPNYATPQRERREARDSQPAWEPITGDGMTERLAVAGGWIVRTRLGVPEGGGCALTYVPEGGVDWQLVQVDARDAVGLVDLYFGGETGRGTERPYQRDAEGRSLSWGPAEAVWFTAAGSIYIDSDEGGVLPVYYIPDARIAPDDIAPFRINRRGTALDPRQFRRCYPQDDRPLVYAHWYRGDLLGLDGEPIQPRGDGAIVWTWPTGAVAVVRERDGVLSMHAVGWDAEHRESVPGEPRPYPAPFTLSDGLVLSGTAGWVDAPAAVVVSSSWEDDALDVPPDLDTWLTCDGCAGVPGGLPRDYSNIPARLADVPRSEYPSGRPIAPK